MASLKEYYDKDFDYTINASFKLRVESTDRLVRMEVSARVHYDFNANAKYLSFFIPSCADTAGVCVGLLNNLREAFHVSGDVHVQLPSASQVYGGFKITNSDPVSIQAEPFCEPPIDDTALPFSGRIFFYTEDFLLEEIKNRLNQQCQQNGIRLRFRSQDFADKRAVLETPLAFISHDSRDKNEVARPIAIKLQQMLCPVWFDDFSLKVGDSLRESIEKGIKECKKCILILSPHFLSNNGWTKVEFNSVFTKQILEQSNLILPVWHGVTTRDVYEYSPTLADKVGVSWKMGEDEVCRRLYTAIIDDRHTST